ncbi:MULTISPECIES: thiamine-phosphate kinase [unclassified Rhodococcus (in: high G+C Gram-positive bacteria)]|uniref:thiamine-phosphate kinase n=1 Tax=unclassified Rhodococcus (in: high G+C Gram-positive bacteria) TaxID=192944 RepID=UPI0015C64E58|nr:MULTISPECIES: AIR synthase related protein [unclassified Rhodococcus (in: high G+C Gram-positive bacteria)]
MADFFLNGFGHDASVIELGSEGDEVLVTKIDRAAQPVATRRGWADYTLWGWLATAACASDILAVGGRPKAMMLSLILPRTFEVSAATQIIAGCVDACAAHGMALVGGDTKEGPSQEVVGSAFGIAKRDLTFGRTGGGPGDYLVLAGKLGGYQAAYTRLSHDDSTGENDDLLAYVSRPTARLRESLIMIESGMVVSAIDLSDGLYDAVSVLSGEHGALIDEVSLPMHAFAQAAIQRSGGSPLDFAFGVGDWGMLFAIRESSLDLLTGQLRGLDVDLAIVGVIQESEGIFAKTISNGVIPLAPIINEHFATRMEDEGRYFSLLDSGRKQEEV